MLVIDASVLAPALADDGEDGSVARRRLAGERLTAPELIDLEVASALRGQVLGGKLAVDRAEMALADLVVLPMQRVPHRHLVRRGWRLRDNVTVYDAAYIALAELLAAAQVTADRRLATVPGLTCAVEVLCTH